MFGTAKPGERGQCRQLIDKRNPAIGTARLGRDDKAAGIAVDGKQRLLDADAGSVGFNARRDRQCALRQVQIIGLQRLFVRMQHTAAGGPPRAAERQGRCIRSRMTMCSLPVSSIDNRCRNSVSARAFLILPGARQSAGHGIERPGDCPVLIISLRIQDATGERAAQADRLVDGGRLPGWKMPYRQCP